MSESPGFVVRGRSKRPIVVVNRFFAPDHSATAQLLSDLAFAWAAEGRDVTVVTSRQLYGNTGAELPAREDIRGVRVVRVAMTRFGRYNLAGRTVDLLTFYVAAGWSLLQIVPRGGVVIAKTDPPLISVVTAAIARIKGATSVNWLQDVFPEVAERVGIGTGRLARAGHAVLRALRNASLRHAACNVVLGERMAAEVGAAGAGDARIAIVPNWADGTAIRPVAPGDNSLRRAWGLADKFVVCYSGNLGRAHDYHTFLDAIARCEAADAGRAGQGRPAHWLFIGGGVGFAPLMEEARRRGLASISFQPYQAASRLSESLSVADVHLVSLRPELEGLIVPSKYYGIAAVGRPTIFLGDGDGEIARILRLAGCGLTVAEGDGAGLAAAVAGMAADPERAADMGARARRDFERRFDRPHAIRAWSEVIDGIDAGASATVTAAPAWRRGGKPG